MTKSIPQFEFAPMSAEFSLRGEVAIEEHVQKVHRHVADEIPMFVDSASVESGRAIIAGEMEFER